MNESTERKEQEELNTKREDEQKEKEREEKEKKAKEDNRMSASTGKAAPAGNVDKRKSTVKKEETKYEVEKIIDHRVNNEGGVEYLVVWKGYKNNEKNNTWQPVTTLGECAWSIDVYKELRACRDSKGVRKSNGGNHSQKQLPKTPGPTKKRSEDKESCADSMDEFASALNKKAKLSAKKPRAKSTPKKAKTAGTESKQDKAPLRRKKNCGRMTIGKKIIGKQGIKPKDDDDDSFLKLQRLTLPKTILTKEIYMQISKKFKAKATPPGTNRTIFGTDAVRCLQVFLAERALLIELGQVPKGLKYKVILVDLQLAAEIIPTIYEEAVKRLEAVTGKSFPFNHASPTK